MIVGQQDREARSNLPPLLVHSLEPLDVFQKVVSVGGMRLPITERERFTVVFKFEFSGVVLQFQGNMGVRSVRLDVRKPEVQVLRFVREGFVL